MYNSLMNGKIKSLMICLCILLIVLTEKVFFFSFLSGRARHLWHEIPCVP